MRLNRILVLTTIALFLVTTLKAQEFNGFFDFSWEEKTGKIWLEIGDQLDKEFLYVNSLSAGVGSNDIGLDRNQLGQNRIVKFVRSGPKILLMELNYDYRAVSDNPEERRAVEEAFARSVIWGFKMEEKGGGQKIDLTPFLLRDAHGIANRLESNKQGAYKVDPKRSAMYLPRTKNFLKNSEFDAIITFTGLAKGDWIRSVTPTSSAVTVHTHHSFIELPDDNYQPRVFDPRSGFYSMTFADYAVAIDAPLEKRYITRHRLNKKDPGAIRSEAIEPIIYYIDPGCPEPIKSALMEGARWWNQAFDAAGYIDAFQVKELPEGADPMDVRYNMINWVHRSTRGWSYGSSITDPRTGEILKGHVLLGSLRVRQDFLIAQGLANLFINGDESTEPLVQMALARLRQLSAHEVGHTIGLAHNFAASVNDRASVMDYPHPYITLKEGVIDFSEAYDVGIGEWDKRTVIYGYQDFPDGTNEDKILAEIIAENQKIGLDFISDQDARPAGGAHPGAHLWDNGSDAIDELKRISEVRAHALRNFGENTIPNGTPYAYLEQVLVPLYLSHRYQVDAVSKMIGGVNYTYALRGDGQTTAQPVDPETQADALSAMLITLDPEFLTLNERIIRSIPPQPIGYSRHRELFKTYGGVTFDPLGAAESSINHTLFFLLHPQRLTRIVEQHARDDQYQSLTGYLQELCDHVVGLNAESGLPGEIKRMIEKQLLGRLLALAGDKEIHQQVAAGTLFIARNLKINVMLSKDEEWQAHRAYLGKMMNDFDLHPAAFKLPVVKEMPPGSPIGCGDGR